jgi:ERCC4-type nuclease
MKPFKTLLFPKGFHVIVDTREKFPLTDELPDTVPIVHKALKAGDYSIFGLEHIFAIERKSPEDFLACIGSRRVNFEKQINKLSKIRRPFLIVEASLESILHPVNFGSRVHPNSVWGSILALQSRTSIPLLFFETRLLAARWTVELLLAGWHAYKKGLYNAT